MPIAAFSIIPATPNGMDSMAGYARGTLVWMLTVAVVIVLLPVILVETPPPQDAEAWLTFSLPDYTPIAFKEASPVVIRSGLIRPWPAEPDDGSDSVDSPPWKPKMAYDALRWLESQQPPLRPKIKPSGFQYKLDPDFGFDNREIHLNGLMFHMQMEF